MAHEKSRATETTTVVPTQPSIHLAAIDNGLAFPFKHPDEWRTCALIGACAGWGGGGNVLIISSNRISLSGTDDRGLARLKRGFIRGYVVVDGKEIEMESSNYFLQFYFRRDSFFESVSQGGYFLDESLHAMVPSFSSWQMHASMNYRQCFQVQKNDTQLS
jgi:hypothetical protein